MCFKPVWMRALRGTNSDQILSFGSNSELEQVETSHHNYSDIQPYLMEDELKFVKK
jgi:hypothetical protein